MSFNKKIIRNTVISIIVVVFLGVSYYFVEKWQPNNEERMESGSESISVYSTEEKNILKIVYKNGDESFSIVREDEDSPTKWYVPEKRGIEFSQNKLQSAVYDLTSISASKMLGDKVESLADFGLETEDKTATIYTGIDEVTVIIGNKVAVDSSYYLRKKGESQVYIVPEYVANSILKTPNDFRERTLAGIDPMEITRLAIKRGEERFLEFVKNETSQNSEIRVASLVMTYPYADTVRVDPINEMLSAFTEIEVIDFISEDLADSVHYGLDKGWSVELKTDMQTHRIRFGSVDEKGNLYATYNDCGFIFTMSPDMQNAFKDIKPFDLIDKFAHLYMIGDVRSIEVKIGETSYVMEIEGNGEDGKYMIDGKSVSEKAFKEVYQIVVGRMITDTVKNEEQKGKQVAEITFEMIDGKKNTARYYEYDDRSFVVERPDGKKYLMLRKYIDELKEKMEEF